MALLNLSVEETEWLVETTPALKELKDNEALTAVMEDDHIMDLVMEAGQGSMKAVYALGDEPGIRQIIEDPVIAKHIKMLDLREMREAALNYRRRNETVLPVIWHVASISFPHEMDAALTNAEMWTSVNATDEYCEWNDDTTFALVRAAFVVHAPIRVLTCCETEGTPTQWINDKKTAFKEHGGRRQAEVVLENGTTEIVVLIDFRKVKPPKICSVYVVLESGSR
jgi:hypothetical protein